jgi:hypothetical protein
MPTRGIYSDVTLPYLDKPVGFFVSFPPFSTGRFITRPTVLFLFVALSGHRTATSTLLTSEVSKFAKSYCVISEDMRHQAQNNYASLASRRRLIVERTVREEEVLQGQGEQETTRFEHVKLGRGVFA